MSLYLIFFAGCLFFALRNNSLIVKSSEKLFLVLLGVFLCTGYMTGSDWRGYELDYYEVKSINDCLEKPGEVVFYLICMVFNNLNLNFWIFWIAIKVICFCITIRKIIELSGKNRWWTILFFYSYYSLFYYIDNPMRNLIASIIIIYFINIFIHDNYKRKIFVLLGASFFHVSSILAAPMLMSASKVNITMKKALIVFIVLYLFAYTFWFSGLSQQVTLLMTVLSGENYRGQLYMLQGEENGGIILSIGSIFQIIVFLISTYNYKKMKTDFPLDKFMYNISFFYICFLICEIALPILGRLSMFFFLPYILFIVKYLINIRKLHYTTIMTKFQPIFMFTIAIFLFSVVLKNITNSYRYIPYSSYLEYVFNEKPKYEYRESYNYLNSPYRKNEDNSN